MKKLFPILMLMMMTTNTNAQTTDTGSVATSAAVFSHSDTLASENSSATLMELQRPLTPDTQGNLVLKENTDLRVDNSGSFKRSPVFREKKNPYKVRNTGIGFLIGGGVNAAAGLLLVLDNQENDTYGVVAVVGMGAVVVGGASMLAGTICTIAGAIYAHKYQQAYSRFQIKSKGKAIALTYNF